MDKADVELPFGETNSAEFIRPNNGTDSNAAYIAIAELYPALCEGAIRSVVWLQQQLGSAPTDPDEIAAAEQGFLEFKRAMNQTRRGAWARVHYPDVD